MGIYKMCDILKMTGRRAKRTTIWASGVLFTGKCSETVGGHSVHFRFLQPCIWKTAGRRAKQMKIWVLGLTTYRFLRLSFQV